MGAAKVSIIIPVYNSSRFLRDCLDSALYQSLQEIEVICINDGSTDSSLEILHEYEQRDSRIVVIDKPNSGYGNTMNRGIEAATGEYIAFLESDDCIEEDAYRRLASVADEFELDIVKGDYFELRDFGVDRKLEYKRLANDESRYNRVVRPLDEPWTFYVPMMNCLGVMRRSFIERNGIRHLETPGASHQDMGFWWETFCCADRLMFIQEAFYMYRQDNENSSMKDSTTAFFVLEEYAYMRRFLSERPTTQDEAFPIFFHRKFGSCMFAYKGAKEDIRLKFLEQLGSEFKEDYRTGCFTFERFSSKESDDLRWIMSDPEGYYFSRNGDADRQTLETVRQLASEASRLRRQVDWCMGELNTARHEEATLDEGDWQTDLLLSVVIPVYNSSEYLQAMLDSVLGQDFSSMEVICVDDGSTDDSLDVLTRFQSDNASIKVLSQPNNGQSAARNVGLRHAKGKYVYFMDSDDALEPGCFDLLIHHAEADSLDLLYFDARTSYDSEDLHTRFSTFDGNYQRPSNLGFVEAGPEMFLAMKKAKAYRVSPCMLLIRRRYLEENSIVFLEGCIYEDNAFMLRCLLSAKRVSHINEAFYIRRIRQDSTMTSLVTSYQVSSYFSVYLDMLDFALNHRFDDDVEKAIQGELNSVKHQIQKKYSLLPPSSRSFVDSFSAARKGVFLSIARDEPSRSEAKAQVKKALDKVHASNSWRIGRSITAPARWLKRSMRSGHTTAAVSKDSDLIGKAEPVDPAALSACRHDCSDAVPQVSVIMPLYNVECYLSDCLNTLSNQSLSNIEIICVDDGSTDGTLAIANSYAAVDGRITVIHQENAGAAAARNRGLKVAKGEYLSILDADDFFELDMLEKAYSFAIRFNADMIIFRADQYIDQEQRFASTPWTVKADQLPAENPFSPIEVESPIFVAIEGWTWDKLFKRSFVVEHSLKFQDQPTYNDMLFTFSAYVLAQRIAFLDEVFAHQRKRGGGSISDSASGSYQYAKSALRALWKVIDGSGFSTVLQRDFRNYALALSLYQLSICKGDDREAMLLDFADSALEEFGLAGQPSEYFYRAVDRDRFRDAMAEVARLNSGTDQRG